MCFRICNHVNPVYPLLNPLQQGFRPNRSCVSRLIQHVNFLALSRDNGGKIYIIYLDMAKAFDRVPHQKLLFKLRYYGFWDPLLSWVADYLTNRRHCVAGNQLHRVSYRVLIGPILFLIYINKISSSLSQGPILPPYADDAK